MAQGFANIGSALFGGISVTGMIARTATKTGCIEKDATEMDLKVLLVPARRRQASDLEQRTG